jgi:hypothetical protein
MGIHCVHPARARLRRILCCTCGIFTPGARPVGPARRAAGRIGGHLCYNAITVRLACRGGAHAASVGGDMATTNENTLTQAPTPPGVETLAFADAEGCAAWLRSLPLTNIPRHYEAVLGQLKRLSDADITPRERARIAEVMREPVNFLHTELARRYAGKPQPAADREREAFTQATALWQALRTARAVVRSARAPVPAARLARQLRRQIERQPDARVDYIEFFAPDTLQPVRAVRRGTHLALAVRVGQTRLIDNAAL